MIQWKKGGAPGGGDDRDLARDIARFESMSLREINDQLQKYGIDPAQTVATVTELVRTKLAQWDESAPAAKKNR